MGSCQPKTSPAWLNICSTGAAYGVFQAHRAEQLTRQLGDPSKQFLSLAVFVGSATRDRSLRNLFPDLKRRDLGQYGTIDLRLREQTTSDQYPLFLAAVDPTKIIFDSSPTTDCGAWLSKHSISWTVADDVQAFDQLFSRLILPFADVLVVAAADVESVRSVGECLDIWSSSIRGSHWPETFLPHIIVLTEGKEAHCLQAKDRGNLSFPSIKSFDVDKKHPRSTVWTSIKETMSDMLEHSRNHKMQQKLLFSVPQYMSLFNRAVQHFCRTPEEAFDLVVASRACPESGSNANAHIEHCYQISENAGNPSEVTKTVLASSLVAHAMPTGMHGKFTSPSFEG